MPDLEDLGRLARQLKGRSPTAASGRVLQAAGNWLLARAGESDDFYDPSAMAADRALPVRPGPGGRPHVGFVVSVPRRGAGGMGSVARVGADLLSRGYGVSFTVADPAPVGDVPTWREVLGSYADLAGAEVVDGRDGVPAADVLVATSWATAYVVERARPPAGLYLVQDYEPWFYPAGSLALMAEQSYRLGLRGVTAGRWLAQKLSEEHGMPCRSYDFGADPATYHVTGVEPRDGVVFYARPSTPRRAWALGLAALGRFRDENPDAVVHLVGQEGLGTLPFPAVQHGLLAPAQLADLYNRCAAGLVLSASNMSLLPLELLACGCRPVVNDAAYTRGVVDSPEVRYAPPTPWDLAAALTQAFLEARADPAGTAAAARRTVLVPDRRPADVLEDVLTQALADPQA